MEFRKFFELFDNPQPVDWENKNRANFQVGKNNYQINAEDFNFRRSNCDYGKGFTVNFGLDDGESVQTGLTQSGNASMVMGTMTSQLLQLMKESPESLLVFTAKEPSRISLYRRLIQKFAGNRKFYQQPSSHSGKWLFIISPYALDPQEVAHLSERF